MSAIQRGPAERVLRELAARRPPAALAIEIAALVGGADPTRSAGIDAALIELDAEKAIVVRDHAAPDPHLEGVDLRVIALVDAEAPTEAAEEAAIEAAEAVWSDWLRQFLATHRCT